MLGREAYQNPWTLAGVDPAFYAQAAPVADRAEAVAALIDWAQRAGAGPSGWPLRLLSRHVLGLFNGQPGARRWRQMLSDPRHLDAAEPALLLRAAQAVSATGAVA
jgi:tRNA-dihydrouridine synthase A